MCCTKANFCAASRSPTVAGSKRPPPKEPIMRKSMLWLFLAVACVTTACSGGDATCSKPKAAQTWGGQAPHVWHDDVRGVTCWIDDYHFSLSCLPDSALKPNGQKP